MDIGGEALRGISYTRHCDSLSRLTTVPVVVSAHAPDSCRSRSSGIILITRTQFPVPSKSGVRALAAHLQIAGSEVGARRMRRREDLRVLADVRECTAPPGGRR